ncbi:ATP-binding protein [Snodgrassella alvi]|uniref:ATP-binding protein n=1 Tax=Snodgrassella alvi TaxID=1196083 RepID=UPI003516BA98
MSITVGEVIAVSGVRITLRIFKDSNQETIFYNGVKYRGVSLGEHISIQRGFIDIVGIIEGEYLDEKTFDSDLEKIQYIRKVEMRPLGYIMNNKFYEGVKYMPMILDKAYLLSENMVGKIYGIEDCSNFSIGNTLKEDIPINLPWMRIFNSHIGIFGNTGSGKSNTLTKLYTTLFNEKKSAIKEKSQFVIIDFNGEYTKNQIIPTKEKLITILNTRKEEDKFPINNEHFWDEEILSLLFKATINTQKPFLRRVINGRKKYKDKSLKDYLAIVFRSVFTTPEAKPNALDICREIAQKIGDSDLQKKLNNIEYFSPRGVFRIQEEYGCYYFNSEGNSYEKILFPIIDSQNNLEKIDEFDELLLRCYLRFCSDIVYVKAQYEHIQPLIIRAEASLSTFQKVLKIVPDSQSQPLLHVISLRKCNNEIKKILPLLIAKNLYSKHKDSEANISPPNKTLHFIIDEAHNILSEQSTREHELWKDYRLELFEEIIKEGRKYGVFLTLASQRPADISPTIVSQIHNFFIHRLVNEKDLMLLDNTISTLDKNSKMRIPCLAKGCCVVTGTAFDLPMILKVDPLEKKYRPLSDDVDLEKLWKINLNV